MSCSERGNHSTASVQMVKEEMAFSSPRIVSQQPNTTPLPPQESLKTFRLPKGYRLEVVASEPMISEPVALAWDGNGRMYVAQLETYMQTVDAKDQNEPRSRIMLLEDTDNDGRMDKSSVFLDKLLSPRMMLCIGNELLVNETNTFDIYAYKDSNGDGKADQKRPVFQTENKAYGNVEHQRSGLDWNLDNWIYVTTDPVRFRYKQGRLMSDSLVSGSNGQWGLTHDNYGRLFFSRAASGMAATGFHLNPAYGQLDFDDAYDSTFHQVWPVIKTPDVNGGPKTLRADSTLKSFTSVCGQSVFRGDRLPQTMVGDYLAAEPVGRFIRRAKITNEAGKKMLTNAYQQDEFISSTDMNFRPVNTYSGPDGCLYIVDMYRGIIQESTWAQPGSYLYDQIMTKGLEKNIKNGRIYRLVYEGIAPGPKPQMLNESTAKLVTYLDHPNGWWRDNAQKEIILRGDKSVVPALRQISLGEKGPLSTKPSFLARLHALWTLEGLDATDKQLLVNILNDPDAQLRKAAIRISEPYLKQNDRELVEKLISMAEEQDTDVRMQLVVSLYSQGQKKTKSLADSMLSNSSDDQRMAAIQTSLQKNEEAKKYGVNLVALKDADRRMVMKGAAIFQTLCASCHGSEGQGLSTNIAPPLVSKFKLIEQKESVIKILLHGLKGPVDGKTYPDIMPPMGANDDEWIASVLNYVRYDLCMRSFPKMSQGYIDWVLIKPEGVKKIREQHAGRKEPWTWDELISNAQKPATQPVSSQNKTNN
ncbi:HEAT repeat domain-containing protein [Rhodocytophaga aerolata]|uniref:HEAT repeat domain-containing protein n=1 Tax=Rhodocytophaga aerolata TaxID=455078 RepID=A0ABT8R6M8_9BACT|nr:HEAT repeat domain-containing protein [Rhodocytophaga aerolata]MDO1447742.1 HEAT repeat domain-containing protein [Rhodocytophaga aerolata]